MLHTIFQDEAKSETNPKFKPAILETKLQRKVLSLSPSLIRICFGFRVSGFGFI